MLALPVSPHCGGGRSRRSCPPLLPVSLASRSGWVEHVRATERRRSVSDWRRAQHRHREQRAELQPKPRGAHRPLLHPQRAQGHPVVGRNAGRLDFSRPDRIQPRPSVRYWRHRRPTQVQCRGRLLRIGPGVGPSHGQDGRAAHCRRAAGPSAQSGVSQAVHVYGEGRLMSRRIDRSLSPRWHCGEEQS